MRFKFLGYILLFFISINLVSAVTWTTTSQADWDLGTYNNTVSHSEGYIDLVSSPPDENITNHLVISEIQIDSIDGTGGTYDDWIEIYNPTGSAIDLNASSYRIERISSGGGDPAILMRIGDATDGTYPGGVTISAYGFYLIVRDDAAQSFLDMADAICTDSDFTLTDSNTIYLGTGPISGPGDADIVDWVGYGAATDCNGTCAPQPPDGGSIERKAQSDSTAVDLASGGAHEDMGNGIDVDNNSIEFVSQANDNPQNHTETENPPVAEYKTQGNYTSKVYDAEQELISWDTIDWNETLVESTHNLTFQVRSSNDINFGSEAVILFFDNFEGNNLTVKNWTTSGPGAAWSPSGDSPFEGNYLVEADNTDGESILQNNISTIGYTNLTLTFYYDTDGLDSGEYIAADYYNGSDWFEVLNVEDTTGWTLFNYSLNETAENNENFSIRFRCNSSTPNEECKVDNVKLVYNITETPFIGPDGTANTYYTNGIGENLNVSNAQYFQFKAYLNTSNTTSSPLVEKTNINYTLLTVDTNWDSDFECNINNYRNFSNQNITVNCDLTIESSGEIDFDNVNLFMNQSLNYEYDFIVQYGGTINTYNTTFQEYNESGFNTHYDISGTSIFNKTSFDVDSYLRCHGLSQNTLKNTTTYYYTRFDGNSNTTIINSTFLTYATVFADDVITTIVGNETNMDIGRFYQNTNTTITNGTITTLALYADTDCTVFIDNLEPSASVTNHITATGCSYDVELNAVSVTNTQFAGEANGIAYINNSIFNGVSSGRATSQTHVENTVFSDTWITLETAKLYAKNSNFTGAYTSFRGTSDSNFTTPYSRITNIEVDGEGSLGEHVPIIRGYIDLTTLYGWSTNASTNRYFPIYVQTVGGNPDPTKNVTIKKDSVYITSGITDVDGYVNLNVTFNETNYNQNYSFYVEDVFRSNFTFMNDTSPNGIILRESIIIYNITDCVELQGMENNLSGDYTLMNNINCSDTINWNDGAGFDPIGDSTNKFEGNLDGKNYNITDLFMVRGTNTGLFGYISNNGIISNVHLKDINITGGSGTGSIAGYVKPGKIENCSVTGFLNGTENVGGMVGNNDGSIILNSWTDIDVYSTGNYVGGIFGVVYAGGITINNTYAIGDVTGAVNYVGGLGGDDGTGSVSNSYAIGKVTTSGTYVGGLLGRNGGTVKNCFATGNVSGTTAGGLIGVHSGTIINSYYNNHAGNPDWCVGNGVQTGCTAIQNNEDYFKDNVYPCYGPMSTWDFFSTWEERDNDYPSLTFQDLGGSIDSCTAPGTGNWTIEAGDNCTWTTNQSIPGNMTLDLGGVCTSGLLTLNATFNFTSINQFIIIKNSSIELDIIGGGFN